MLLALYVPSVLPRWVLIWSLTFSKKIIFQSVFCANHCHPINKSTMIHISCFTVQRHRACVFAFKLSIKIRFSQWLSFTTLCFLRFFVLPQLLLPFQEHLMLEVHFHDKKAWKHFCLLWLWVHVWCYETSENDTLLKQSKLDVGQALFSCHGQDSFDWLLLLV